MLKELILAVIIGAILGLGVTGGYMTMKSKNNPPKTNQITAESIPTSVINQEEQLLESDKKDDILKIISPENNTLLNTDKTSISGTTSKDSNIIITTATNSFIGKSDKDGNFKININLESGLNNIKITSIDSDNNQKEISINITYSTAKI